MDIYVLGAPRVIENGVLIAAPTPEARHVLAVLAVCPDRLVPVSVLADELAHGLAPRHGHTALHRAVRRLRERLAEACKAGSVRTPETVLSGRPGGYVLDTAGGRSDAREFAREAGAGYRAMSRGDFDQAGRRLRQALALWTGPTLDGIDAGPWLRGRVAALDADRRAVLGQWVEAELARGRDRELLLELAGLRGGHERTGGAFLADLCRAEARVEARVEAVRAARPAPGLPLAAAPGLRIAGAPGQRIADAPGLRIADAPGAPGTPVPRALACAGLG